MTNHYAAISAFAEEDKAFRRRKSQFAGLYAVMIDDLGTKLPMSAMPTGLFPSLAVETSPGNYQATYFLTEVVPDMEEAEDGIKRMIEVLTGGGLDPGMAGVTRVMRLPDGINGKKKYEKDGQVWRCKVSYWRPDTRTDWAAFARHFGFVSKRRVYIEPNDGVTRERMRGYRIVRDGLHALKAVKREGGGWIEMRCPWVGSHTDRVDSGAAVAKPAAKNGYYGGFRCHHGHCANKGWADLEAWVQQEIEVEAKRTAGPFQGVKT